MTSTSWTPLPSLSFGWKYDRLEAHILTLSVTSHFPASATDRHRGAFQYKTVPASHGLWHTGELPGYCWYTESEVYENLDCKTPLRIPFTAKDDLALLLPEDLRIHHAVRLIPVTSTGSSPFFLLTPAPGWWSVGRVTLDLDRVDRSLPSDEVTNFPFKAFLDRLEFDNPSLIQVLVP